MELNKSLNKIKGNKIYLRKLRIKDANKIIYLGSMMSREYIISAKSTNSIKKLKDYIRTKNASPNVLLLEYLLIQIINIGNIKYLLTI